MGTDKLAENTPNFIGQNCLPNPKSLGFRWKKAYLGVRSPFFIAKKKRGKKQMFLIKLH